MQFLHQIPIALPHFYHTNNPQNVYNHKKPVFKIRRNSSKNMV